MITRCSRSQRIVAATLLTGLLLALGQNMVEELDKVKAATNSIIEFVDLLRKSTT